MTEEEVLKQYNEMVEMFGELPNFEQEPRRFAYYVKLYRYYKERRSGQENTGQNGMEPRA